MTRTHDPKTGKQKPSRPIDQAPQHILDRVERESESIGTSGLARTADKTARKLNAGNTDEDDAIEIWGKRIGRGLGAVMVVYLIYHLVTTYVLKG